MGGAPADSYLWLLNGNDEVSDEQLGALEQVVVPEGLVPRNLRNNPTVRRCAGWVFSVARAKDARFRSRLLEFWTGTSRIPLAGPKAITPRPRATPAATSCGC